jgi:hypothetical protein
MDSPREFPLRNESDKRVFASVTLLSVVVCAIGVFALVPRAPSSPTLSGNRLAEATPPPAVKIIDGAARSDLCAEQTWPYYDRRCLARRNEAASTPAVPAPQSTAASPPTLSPPSSAAPPFIVPAAEAASHMTARRTTDGPVVTSATVPETDTVGAASRANAAPLSLPAARVRRSEPNSVNMQGGNDRLIAWEDDDARRLEPVTPVKQPRRRAARRHHFPIFGFRF